MTAWIARTAEDDETDTVPLDPDMVLPCEYCGSYIALKRMCAHQESEACARRTAALARLHYIRQR